MPATSTKQRFVNQIMSSLPKSTDGKGAKNGKLESLPILEQVIYSICREATSQTVADHAYRQLQEKFFDWNEIRVSSAREVADALGDIPNAEDRAERIIHFLSEVFEIDFCFDLEGLHKKGLKQASGKLKSRYQVSDDFSIPWVIQRSLGGHALPLDDSSVRMLHRLGLAETDKKNTEALRSSLEHLVPKAKGSVFTDSLSYLANEFCSAEQPSCDQCPMSEMCPKIINANEANLATSGASES